MSEGRARVPFACDGRHEQLFTQAAGLQRAAPLINPSDALRTQGPGASVEWVSA
jgi:hypothetical protein